jgi:hypothetical protein
MAPSGLARAVTPGERGGHPKDACVTRSQVGTDRPDGCGVLGVGAEPNANRHSRRPGIDCRVTVGIRGAVRPNAAPAH